jgi:GNAT superfamily N-acetyltransferase
MACEHCGNAFFVTRSDKISLQAGTSQFSIPKRGNMAVTRDVLPVTHQSYQECARVLGRAFVDEPVSIAVYPGFSAEKRQRNLSADFATEIEVCVRRGFPLQVCEQGRVVAAALIYPPGSYPLPAGEQMKIFIKSIWGHDLYDLRPLLRWLAEIDKIHPAEPHYYLEYMGVEPEYQGQGFGSAIFRHVTARADAEKTGCYLETASPQNVCLYQRFGFQVIAEKQVIGLPAWFMWRPPA